MANACEKCKSFPVQCRCEELRLKEALRHIDTCLMILKNTKSEEGIRDLPELINNLKDYVTQALKENEDGCNSRCKMERRARV